MIVGGCGGVPISQFDLLLNHYYVFEIDMSVEYFMVMQGDNAVE